jgi:hypothetical protein
MHLGHDFCVNIGRIPSTMFFARGFWLLFGLAGVSGIGARSENRHYRGNVRPGNNRNVTITRLAVIAR